MEINKRACELAHEAIAEFAHDGRKRFVIGAIGPGTKLPSLGHIDYDALEASFILTGAWSAGGQCRCDFGGNRAGSAAGESGGERRKDRHAEAAKNCPSWCR